ncbi:MAG: hypothetical protein VE98_C0001G0565 [candidate division Kazan bacterium GW2011_GWA1_50_15]|uniref:Conjugal transfer protein TrbC n=2 Tax=Bacteria division Kazan-3B-28 TaxID=1798534 RepID=A0A0G1X8A9_UNCK3|nr:MAG: hypothetical protein VE98_C0001G0565 [candidate division Kazan bacterium GW2011_GWA1_50_15]KKW25749.1 MAG: hypothetical protein VE99_C0001G0388 [candidate division Kazan bacterium GW2011_GWC1_52_13]KKW27236.1 MAG: hypothetical protein VF00_C0001G0171 [candidate division Kazan bacterium GW2011_GWB1_52_7]HAV65962.1 hypothetical protein [Patescibacteria group bacterium]HCR42530.1 hypothetical protein [Patescibacteria group bacterium]
MKKVLSYVAGIATALSASVLPVFAQVNPIPTDLTSEQSIFDTINNGIAWVFGIAGLIAVGYLVFGGITYITGGAKGAESGRQMITNALVGVVIIGLSYAIVNAVIGFLG